MPTSAAMRTCARIVLAPLTLALAASGLLGVSVAQAETLDVLGVAKALADFTDSEGRFHDELAVLDNVAHVTTDPGGDSAIDATVNGVDVMIPVDPSDSLTIGTESSASVEVGLPYAASASDAEVIDEGVVAYDNRNGSVTLPVMKADGSVQITTVIAGRGNPQADTPTPSGYLREAGFSKSTVAPSWRSMGLAGS